MEKKNKIIIIILTVLSVTTITGVLLNMQFAREKAILLEKSEISVLEDGLEVARLNMNTIKKLPVTDFAANLKSSVMKSPEEHIYTGVALNDLLIGIGISLENKNKVVVRSIDGYTVTLTIEEIQALDNIYLVFRDNGKYLGSYREPQGQGPYMIVIRGDLFSQRWAKYVCEMDIR